MEDSSQTSDRPESPSILELLPEHEQNNENVPSQPESTHSNNQLPSEHPQDLYDRISLPLSSESNQILNFDAEIQNADTNSISEPVVHYNEDSSNSHTRENINMEEGSLQSAPETENDADEPPAKVRKIEPPKDDVDGETCPICLDMWSNTGEHRLVALKCGHLFGAHCVERWLKAQNSKDRSCPTCKSKASMKDIRHIYARKLVSVDTTRVTELEKQLEAVQAENTKIWLELQKTKIEHKYQIEYLKNTLRKQQVNGQPLRKLWRFALEKNLEISKDGGCRVATYNCRTYELYVSQKSTNNLFPGYGIRKVSCVDYKMGQFVHLHPKPIRDITYSQPNDMLLSVALDGAVRVVQRGTPNATIQCNVPLWSVSWNPLRTNEFFVGGVGSAIQQYDIRNYSTCLKRLSTTSDLSPVVSLYNTQFGLLSCQLNSCWLWVPRGLEMEPRALPIDGPFMSLCYDDESCRALLSCRAAGNEKSRLTVCKLRTSDSEVLFDVEQSFFGSARSTLMSRSTWVKAQGATWVAAHSESESSLYLHGLDGSRTMSLPASEPALDVCSVEINGDTVLAALSDSRLRLYKAVPTNS